jgi:hypothetical protein
VTVLRRTSAERIQQKKAVDYQPPRLTPRMLAISMRALGAGDFTSKLRNVSMLAFVRWVVSVGSACRLTPVVQYSAFDFPWDRLHGLVARFVCGIRPGPHAVGRGAAGKRMATRSAPLTGRQVLGSMPRGRLSARMLCKPPSRNGSPLTSAGPVPMAVEFAIVPSDPDAAAPAACDDGAVALVKRQVPPSIFRHY